MRVEAAVEAMAQAGAVEQITRHRAEQFVEYRAYFRAVLL